MDKLMQLKLVWNISDFLPVSEELGTITEYIIPESMEDEERERDRWSVPEILLDIRWITEAARRRDPSPAADFRESRVLYDREAYQFSELISGLKDYADRFYTYNQKIEKLYEEKRAFVEYWNRWKQVINRARSRRDYDPAALWRAADMLLEILKSDDPPARAFRENVARNQRGIVNSFERMRSRAETLLGEGAEAENGRIFAAQVYSFYLKYLFQDEEKMAGNELLKLSQSIKKVLAVTKEQKMIPRNSKWDSQYRTAVWDGLQQMTSNLCESFTPAQEQAPPAYFQNQSELVRMVTEEMGREKVSAYMLKQYRDYSKNGRCIAMMDANDHQVRILSLSGFLDCDDPQLQDYLELNPKRKDSREFFEKIKHICESLSLQDPQFGKIELACFSPGVVDRFHYYETEISEREFLRQILNDESRWGGIGSNMACCERKIIAKLESENRTASIRSGRMIIKFPPCDRCKRSLEGWTPVDEEKNIWSK